VHRVSRAKEFSRFFLRDHTGFTDEIHICLRAAIAYWWFVGVHFHNRVVHTQRPQRREHVFDGVHAHRAFANCSGALDRLQVLDFRVDRRLILQIFTLEFNSVIHRRGMQSKRNFLTSVQRDAGKTGNFAKSLLKLGSGHCALK
jgi:hypothetical protein